MYSILNCHDKARAHQVLFGIAIVNESPQEKTRSVRSVERSGHASGAAPNLPTWEMGV
jgi:hypothetical protein